MDHLNIFSLNKLISPHERAKYVAFITSVMALIYHTSVMIAFFHLKLMFMFYYNFFSVATFAVLTFWITRAKHFIIPYNLAVAEVIAHQILADYFLGSYSAFHFFILLMGLVPFLVFEDKYLLSVPYTVITSILFVGMEVARIPNSFQCENVDFAIKMFRVGNVTISTITIIMAIWIYTFIAFKTEQILQRTNKRLNTEIELASVIQQNFFKQEQTVYDNWELEFYNHPAACVSGDVYDIFKEDTKLNGYTLMDVSGHGISAGLVTMLVKNIIRDEFYKNTNASLKETVEKINARIVEEKGNIDNYLTGILARINENSVELINAGHPLPIIFRSEEKKCEVLPHPETAVGAIGISGMPSVYREQKFEMKTGDELVFYTDGITEAIDKEKNEYGIDRLQKVLSKNSEKKISVQIENIIQDILNFTGNNIFEDDITLMILRKK